MGRHSEQGQYIGPIKSRTDYYPNLGQMSDPIPKSLTGVGNVIRSPMSPMSPNI